MDDSVFGRNTLRKKNIFLLIFQIFWTSSKVHSVLFIRPKKDLKPTSSDTGVLGFFYGTQCHKKFMTKSCFPDILVMMDFVPPWLYLLRLSRIFRHLAAFSFDGVICNIWKVSVRICYSQVLNNTDADN